MDIWLEVSRNEMHYVADIIPTLKWRGGRLGVRLSLDLNAYHSNYASAKIIVFAFFPLHQHYQDLNNEMHYVADIIPTLKWRGGRLGVRLALFPKDIEKLFAEYREAYFAARITEKASIVVWLESVISLKSKLRPAKNFPSASMARLTPRTAIHSICFLKTSVSF